jgi:hypothetical protein
MADRSWLGLAIRVVGLLVAATTLAWVVSTWAQVWHTKQYATNTSSLLAISYSAIGYTVQFAIGLVLMAKGDVLAKRWLRGLDTRCPTCLYDIRGLKAVVCPECGAPIKPGAGVSSGTSPPGSSSAV